MAHGGIWPDNPVFGSRTSLGMAGFPQTLQNLMVTAVCLPVFSADVRNPSRSPGGPEFPGGSRPPDYLLVLIELFRLRLYSLAEQRIFPGTIIEVPIVSLRREIITGGVLTITGEKILTLCTLILAVSRTLALQPCLEKDRARVHRITITPQNFGTGEMVLPLKIRPPVFPARGPLNPARIHGGP